MHWELESQCTVTGISIIMRCQRQDSDHYFSGWRLWLFEVYKRDLEIMPAASDCHSHCQWHWHNSKNHWQSNFKLNIGIIVLRLSFRLSQRPECTPSQPEATIQILSIWSFLLCHRQYGPLKVYNNLKPKKKVEKYLGHSKLFQYFKTNLPVFAEFYSVYGL